MGRGCAAAAVALLLCGCTKTSANRSAEAPKTVSLPAPLGLPPVPVPAENPPTAEAIELGRRLFFSPVLSVDRRLSCATCHDPRKAFADPNNVSTGVHGKKGVRNAPTVLNAAYSTSQFWDGRAASLEEQVSGPMLNAVEMGNSEAGVVRNVAADPELVALFQKAFGSSEVTMEGITKAIASYERTLVSGNSPFDRYQYGGDPKAMSEAAIRGLEVFRNPQKGNCTVCHTIGAKYALFTDSGFHNLGTGMNPEGEIADVGRFGVTQRPADRGAFRTPSLRNVALTAPYMHDGSLKTLKEVVDFYIGGGSSNPQLDPLIKPLTHLTREERSDLVEFLKSLTGEMPKQ